MVCVRSIRKGEEVFNTYGQMANWQLLHMYGFTEPCSSNSNDTADIPIENLHKVVRQGKPFEQNLPGLHILIQRRDTSLLAKLIFSHTQLPLV